MNLLSSTHTSVFTYSFVDDVDDDNDDDVTSGLEMRQAIFAQGCPEPLVSLDKLRECTLLVVQQYFSHVLSRTLSENSTCFC